MNARRLLGLAVALATLVGPACGGGGGGGGGPTVPPVPPGINFTPASAPSTESVFLQEGGQTSAAKLYLEVRVNEVDDFLGVAFDLEFPSNLLTYLQVQEGSFLGTNTSLEVSETSPGVLVVGHTRLGAQQGNGGSGLLMTLEFLPAGNGNGAFDFTNAQAYRTNSFPQTVEFIGGTVSVQP